MVRQGLRNVAAGANPMELRTGMQDALAIVIDSLKGVTVQIETQDQIAQVATISAADEEIGAMIAEAMAKVGREGTITVDESNSFGIELEIVEGIQFRSGYVSQQFVHDPETVEVVLEDPCILVSETKISAVRDLIPTLETVSRVGRPLVIIADRVEGDALAMLMANQSRGMIKSVVVQPGGSGESKFAMLRDIAILVGAKVISEEIGLRPHNVSIDLLGRARKVVVTRDDTTIVDGKGYEVYVNEYIGRLKVQLDQAEEHELDLLKERLARLSGGMALIKVGAPTALELEQIKHKVVDAVSTTKAAVADGVVPGGGVALLRAQKGLLAWLQGTPEPRRPKPALPPSPSFGSDVATGARIVARALEEPLRQIASNAGMEPGVVVELVREMEGSVGLNAATGEYEDLIAAGVIDAAKVTRSALQNAVSIAALFLTTEVLVADDPDTHLYEHNDGGHGEYPSGDNMAME
jgi:chaperonin GroEL